MAVPSISTPVPAASITSGRAIKLRDLRALLAEEVERLIAVIDRIDGDPDFEDGGDDEPEMGSLERVNQLGWAIGQDAEMNGDENDFSDGAVDEHRPIWNNNYSVGTCYVRDDGAVR